MVSEGHQARRTNTISQAPAAMRPERFFGRQRSHIPGLEDGSWRQPLSGVSGAHCGTAKRPFGSGGQPRGLNAGLVRNRASKPAISANNKSQHGSSKKQCAEAECFLAGEVNAMISMRDDRKQPTASLIVDDDFRKLRPFPARAEFSGGGFASRRSRYTGAAGVYVPLRYIFTGPRAQTQPLRSGATRLDPCPIFSGLRSCRAGFALYGVIYGLVG